MATTAADVMTTTVITLQPTDSIAQAIDTLVKKGISGAPVVDPDGKIIGLISEYDLILAVYSLGLQGPVKKAMNERVVTVYQDAGLDQIADIMLTRKIKRVPVLNEDNKPVGIVSRREILASHFVKDLASPK